MATSKLPPHDGHANFNTYRTQLAQNFRAQVAKEPSQRPQTAPKAKIYP